MESPQYDVLVIGGGPAGMMAAGRAAECGARVLLLEKNATLGKKLLITGGGRCNVTNAEFDRNIFLGKFRDAAKFLFSPDSKFGVESTLEFFNSRGMKTKIEAEKRVFPVSDSAQSVWDTLAGYMQEGNVAVRRESAVSALEAKGGQIQGVRLKDGTLLQAKAYILATGGMSRPETGSTGEGFVWLRKIGHTIKKPHMALVPLRVGETWVKALSGLSLPEAKLTVFQNGKKQESKKGKLLFTHFGLSGPLALNMSGNIGEYLQYGDVTVSVNLFPSMDMGTLDREIQTLFASQKNKQIKNSLGGLMPPLLVPVALLLSKIPPEKPVHSISRAERIELARTLQDLGMTVVSLLGEEKAIVTSGGVDLSEVDFKDMSSRLYPNLYFAGDVLNIDRPSGGYSLQLCWTTGFVAGTSASGK